MKDILIQSEKINIYFEVKERDNKYFELEMTCFHRMVCLKILEMKI